MTQEDTECIELTNDISFKRYFARNKQLLF